ncbi:WcaI family glycosyltransferase [Vannielia litorea]|uniref:WcaI family glycosyltransferase n=1 Tax=Vannielia litorea TaxID=1217970 RepID=UPI0021BDD815|nr:WcaI family glycosyltransferase [Vannielia litorea]
MKILVLGINYAPEIISTAVYNTDLAEGMASRGAEVRVVAAKPYYPEWRVRKGWRGPFWRNRRSEIGVKITHCPLYVPANPTGLKRILHHASFAITALPIALWRGLVWRPDIVFVVAPSMISAPVGWLTARFAGAKAWLHIQDFEVEAAFATGLLKPESRIARAARAFETWVLRRFDQVSTISAPMVAKLRQKQVPQERVSELRNWANLEKVKPLEGPSPMRAELGIRTRYVVLYSGNLANKQGLEIIPDIARRLDHRRDVTFVVCGDGPLRSRLEEMSRGLSSIRFLPLQPLERLSELLGMADIHLLPQIAGAADLVLPSKLTNMLASGRPVLATTEAGTALADEVEGAGLVTRPGDGAAAAEALSALLDDPERRAALGTRARALSIERWDATRTLNDLKAAFVLLCCENRTAPHETPPVEQPLTDIVLDTRFALNPKTLQQQNR